MHSKTSKRYSNGQKNSNKRKSYVADFETTTLVDDCRVWGWGLVEIGDEPATVDQVVIGETMDQFIDELVELENSLVYFHNLKFDGMFILDAILRRGYRYVEEYPSKGEFTSLINDKGQFYTIKIRWMDGGVTELRDSYKKLPMGVDAVARAFKMETLKLDIDYHSHRPVGHRVTDEERVYIAHDVVIVANALRVQFAEGMTKLTVGSDSMAEFKRLTGSKVFERLFPILSDTMDSEIRKAYRGGWTYCDPRFAKTLHRDVEGSTYDVNSLYPSVMMYELLPYGAPIWVDYMPELTDDYPLLICSLTFTAKLKKDHVPCIQIKGSSIFSTTEYVTEVKEPVTLSMTNIDLELWKRQYDLDILSFNGGWLFKGAHGIFDDYVTKWMDVKNNSDGGLKMIAKLHLNSLYGKFATNPNVTGKYPTMEDNVVKLVLGPPETRNPIYTAMGVFITAYARRITITAAQENYSVFAYADTDSIHLLSRNPKGIEVHPDKLGAWKHEYDFSDAMFWRAKVYSELRTDTGRLETHVAGLPRDVAEAVRFEDYYTGKVFPKKLMPKRVPGGIVLVETEFTLN